MELRRGLLLSGYALTAIALAGCVDLRGVSQFAALAASTTDRGAINADYVASLQRRRQFEPVRFHDELLRMQQRREAQLTDLHALQSLLTRYLQAMGKLALGNVVAFDRPLSTLAVDLDQASLLGDEQKRAFSSLGAVLARAVADQYRQRRLGQLIADGNTDFQVAVAALRSVISQGMRADLDVEGDTLQRFYLDLLVVRGDTPPEPIAVTLAGWAQSADLAAIAARQQRIDTYDAALAKIAQAHQSLYDHRNHLEGAEYRRQIDAYTADLLAAYQALE